MIRFSFQTFAETSIWATLPGIECSDKKAYCVKLHVSWAYLSESHSHANLFSLRSIN